jgi:hypothetical protein
VGSNSKKKEISAWTKVPSATKGSSHVAMVARVGKGKDYMTFQSGASLSQFFFLFACVPPQEEAKCPYFTYLFCKRMLRRTLEI